MNDIKTEIVNQVPDPDRDYDWLIGCDSTQSPPIEMVEMSVRDEDKIDRRQMINLETGALQTLDHLQPHRPIWIDQDVHRFHLDQERRMADPGDGKFARLNWWKEWLRATTGALGEQ